MKKERAQFPDRLRILSAYVVIVYHVIGGSVNGDPLISGDTALTLRAVSSMLAWPVSVFWMLTGYLWLDDSKHCTWADVWRNIRRFLLGLCTFGFAYAIMERMFRAGTVTADMFLLAAADVLTGNLWDHMWYLYAAIGVYLFLPVIKPFYSSQPGKSIGGLAALLFFFTLLVPALSGLTGYHFPVAFPIGEPAFYVCTGGLLAKAPLPKKARSLTCLCFLFGSGMTFLSKTRLPFLNPLSSLFTCICAVSVFVLCKSLWADVRPSQPKTAGLAKAAYGIYLIHPFFINLMVKVLRLYPTRFCPMLSVPTAALLIFLLSFLSTALLRKSRVLRTYLL